jgi:hypothetical protein
VGSIVGYVRFSPVFNATKVVSLFFSLLRLLESEIALDYDRSKTLVPPINETEIYLKVELASKVALNTGENLTYPTIEPTTILSLRDYIICAKI